MPLEAQDYRHLQRIAEVESQLPAIHPGKIVLKSLADTQREALEALRMEKDWEFVACDPLTGSTQAPKQQTPIFAPFFRGKTIDSTAEVLEADYSRMEERILAHYLEMKTTQDMEIPLKVRNRQLSLYKELIGKPTPSPGGLPELDKLIYQSTHPDQPFWLNWMERQFTNGSNSNGHSCLTSQSSNGAPIKA